MKLKMLEVGQKKKPYTPKYRKEWQTMDKFSTWISSSKKGETYFHCKLCNGDFLGGLSAVRKHSKSEKHKKNVKVIYNTTRIDTMCNTAKFQTLENQKKRGRNSFGNVYNGT